MDYSNFVPGIMSAPAGPPPPASPQQDAATTKKRNRMLCQRCRHDKQGCHPQNRNWDHREKCARCLERGYECSAPEKAPFKQRKRRATTLGHTPNASASPIYAASMPSLTPSVSAPTPENPRSRPILPWEAGVESIPPENVVPSGTQPDPESTAMSVRKSNEQEARIILARLGDLHATRQILQSDLELCDQVESWIGRSPDTRKIRDAINAAIAAIKHDFRTGLEQAKSFTTKTKDIGPFKEAFVSQLSFVKYRFYHPCAASESSTTDEADVLIEDFDDDDLRERLRELHKRKGVWSAADYLFGKAYGKSSSRHVVHGQSENDVVACYIKASESIKEVFSDIVLEDLDHREIICTGFNQASDSISALPPCHLAVSRANASILLALWKKSTMPLWDVDYLRRTPVHSATYAGKVQGLRAIFQTNILTATNTGCDSFGMTPLAIAACKDDVKTFIRLVGADLILQGTSHKIVDNTGKPISILGLAARNGSVNVVKYIIHSRFAFNFQTDSSELCQALLNNQVCIAHILIDRHSQRKPESEPDLEPNNYDLTDQIIPAQRIADEKGFQDISSKLKMLMPSRQDGLQALDAMVFDRYTNHHAFCEDQTPYDSSQFTNPSDYDFDSPVWSFQETYVPPFAHMDMQGPVIPTPSSGSGAMLSNHRIRQTRHHGPNRAEPP